MFGMFGIGTFELLIIAAILFLVIGVPVTAVIVVLLLVNRSKDRDDR